MSSSFVPLLGAGANGGGQYASIRLFFFAELPPTIAFSGVPSASLSEGISTRLLRR